MSIRYPNRVLCMHFHVLVPNKLENNKKTNSRLCTCFSMNNVLYAFPRFGTKKLKNVQKTRFCYCYLFLPYCGVCMHFSVLVKTLIIQVFCNIILFLLIGCFICILAFWYLTLRKALIIQVLMMLFCFSI